MDRSLRHLLVGAALVVPTLALVGPSGPAHADSLGRPDTVLVSTAPDGSPANDHSDRPQISGDGRYVTFDSYATNLVPGTSGLQRRVYRKDMVTGTTIPISVSNSGAIATGWSSFSYPSDDGNLIAFVSDSQGLAPVKNFGRSVFVRDVAAGTTELISVNSAGKAGTGGASSRPMITGDGRFVAFSSKATNLSPLGGNGAEQVYLRDRLLHTTTLVSQTSTGGLGNSTSYRGTASQDGRYVAFSSFASNMVPGPSQNGEGIFLRDMVAGTTIRVTTRLDGNPGTGGRPYITPDGNSIAFNSYDIFTAGDVIGTSDTFVWDRPTGQFDRLGASSAPNSDPNGDSLRLFLSDDSRYAIWNSFANNLTPNDGNPSGDVFFMDRQTQTTTLLSLSWFGGAADAQSFRPVFSNDGSKVAFLSQARNLVQGDTSTQYQVYYMSSASVTAAGLDTTKPTLAGLSPTAGSTVPTSSPVIFSGTLTDDRIIDRVYVQIKDINSGLWLQPNGSWGSAATPLKATVDNPYTSGSTWSYSANLSPGKYGYTVTGYDVSKNSVKSLQKNFTGG